MQATVVEPFPGVPDGKHHAVRFLAGDIVYGSLAEVAVANGWAIVDGVVQPFVLAEPEVEEDEPKRKRGRPRKD